MYEIKVKNARILWVRNSVYIVSLCLKIHQAVFVCCSTTCMLYTYIIRIYTCDIGWASHITRTISLRTQFWCTHKNRFTLRTLSIFQKTIQFTRWFPMHIFLRPRLCMFGLCVAHFFAVVVATTAKLRKWKFHEYKSHGQRRRRKNEKYKNKTKKKWMRNERCASRWRGNDDDARLPQLFGSTGAMIALNNLIRRSWFGRWTTVDDAMRRALSSAHTSYGCERWELSVWRWRHRRRRHIWLCSVLCSVDEYV